MSESFRRAKAASGVTGIALAAEEVALINQYTLRDHTAEELFAFRTVACDNEIDRDNEAFTEGTLKEFADMFVGKTVLSNHRFSVEGQCARIYAGAVERVAGKVTSYGEPYAQLILRCYIPRTEAFAELIQLIETGIRKEVSVGCSVKKNTCSICGLPYWSAECEHRVGMTYEDNKKCFIRLEEARDAYELSFAAVPIQPAAGVTKSSNKAGKDFLAELHSMMDVIKSLSAITKKEGQPNEDKGLKSKAGNNLDSDAEELIRSANALYAQYGNERE